MNRKIIWMTAAVGLGSPPAESKMKYKKKAVYSKLLLKSPLVFSVMYKRRGHQSGVRNSERTGVVIILEMGVRALHSQIMAFQPTSPHKYV